MKNIKYRHQINFCKILRLWVMPIFLFLVIGLKIEAQTVIAGTVTEVESGESLPAVHIVLLPNHTGGTTNNYGYFRLQIDTLSIDSISFSHIGYHTQVVSWRDFRQLDNIHIELIENVNTLEEVKVSSRSNSVLNRQIGKITILPQEIQNSPTLLGEKDVFKTLFTQPGFMNPKEGFSSLYVRGGGPGENLYILDDAPIFHANHLFGFLSVFNGQAIKNVDVYKAGFPARYGGRLSSILDIRMKEGHHQKWQMAGYGGLISSGLTVEGPLIKDKLTVMVSGRRTYLDFVINQLELFSEPVILNFYDINAKLYWKINENHHISVSSYKGNDLYGSQSTLRFEREYNAFDWGNRLVSFGWNYRLGSLLFSNFRAGYTKFHFNVKLSRKFDNDRFDLAYLSGIGSYFAKWTMDFGMISDHELKAGIQYNQQQFNTGALVTKNVNNPLRNNDSLALLENHDVAMFVEDQYRLNNFVFHGGLRLYRFQSDDFSQFFIEPRLNIFYRPDGEQAIKLSYSKMNQSLHLLASSGGALPTDLWLPATEDNRAAESHLFSLGYGFESSKWPLTLDVETYLKFGENVLGYKEGASFLALTEGPDPSAFESTDILSQTTSGRSRGYGLEVKVEWSKIKYRAKAAYSLAFIRHQLHEVNFNKWFWPSQDRRHQVYISGGIYLTTRWYIGIGWTWGTGVPVPLLTQSYEGWQHSSENFQNNIESFVFKVDGNFRLPNYHRLDLLIRRYGKRKGYWEFGAYNAYMRHNTFYIQEKKSVNGDNASTHVSKALFPIVPSVSYYFTINY